MVLGVMLGLIMVLSATFAGSVCPSSSSNSVFHDGFEFCVTLFYAPKALILHSKNFSVTETKHFEVFSIFKRLLT